MIQVPVRSIWHGQVGVHEKHVNLALLKEQGLFLLLVSNGEVMEIPPDQVQSTQMGRSERRFRDKFGGPDYYLIYYKWVPTAKQLQLLEEVTNYA